MYLADLHGLVKDKDKEQHIERVYTQMWPILTRTGTGTVRNQNSSRFLGRDGGLPECLICNPKIAGSIPGGRKSHSWGLGESRR